MRDSYIEQQSDMLQGNINRMCVTGDLNELKHHTLWSLCRILRIYEHVQKRINLDNRGISIEDFEEAMEELQK